MAESLGTFSESWHRVANQRVHLLNGVTMHRQSYRGERWIVLRNPFSNQYFRLTPTAYEFVARLSAKRTVQEVWEECLSRFPDKAPGQDAVLRLLSQLYFANLLHYDGDAASVKLFARYKQRRQREIAGTLMNLMFMRFPLLDPDSFLVRTLPVVGKIISGFGAVVWAMVVGYALKLVADNFDVLREQGQGVLAPQNLPLMYGALILLKSAHEFGHAYFCRKFGGEVHVMGVLLMIFTPVPYMDATSSWGFRSRWKRALVGAAGMIVEIFVAALATFVWAKTSFGMLHNLAYNMMFIASVSTVIFNANPLLRFDGYYILSDLLEIPNLSQNASLELRHWWERYVFGVRASQSPARTRAEAVRLGIFGIASGIYRVIVFTGVLLVVADRFLLLGIIMAAVCAISWITVPTGKFIYYLATSTRLERVRWRAISITAALAAVVLTLLAVIPFPSHLRAPGILQAKQRSEIVNNTEGLVEKVLASPTSTVIAGQPLLQLTNQELHLSLARALAQQQEIEVRLRQALSDTNADLKPLRSRLAFANQDLEKLKVDEEALTVRAPISGQWIAPRIGELVGRNLARGTAIGLIVNSGAFEFVATVGQDDANNAFAQKPKEGEVRLRGEAGTALPALQWHIVPGGQETLPSPALGWPSGGPVAVSANEPGKAKEPFFEIHADLPSTNSVTLVQGRSGEIRFDLQPEPLLRRWIRQLLQLLQSGTDMITPTASYRRIATPSPPELLQGLDATVDSLAGLYGSRSARLAELRRQAESIDTQAARWGKMTDSELHDELMEFRQQFRRGRRNVSNLLPDALAAIREASERKLGLRPFVVQLMGALALHQGCLAEMGTGEGKTLTAGLAAVLAGWTRHPCHIVTINDYLVERDAEWMRPLYSFCGVRVGWVSAEMDPAARVKGYEADVTYVTSKELLADFLRDRLHLAHNATPSRHLILELSRSPLQAATGRLVMRGLHTAIIDEADGLLIDEAATPLIISASHKNARLEIAVKVAAQIVSRLDAATDYQVDRAYREIRLSSTGQERLASLCGELDGFWQGVDRREELIRQALTAREFFLRDKQYIIEDGKIVIVDEFTGRQMAQRSWRQGLHQAIEAKESLDISNPAETVARLSFQRFFRCFHRLAGMTGTAREAAAEFWRIYKLPVITIPPNKPSRLAKLPEQVFLDSKSKWQAIALEIERTHSTGRPILVGTRSVQSSENLGGMLADRGLPCRILNATRHKDEAVIVAMSGEPGNITIATNMAGRGTDIKLGRGVADLGGLHVIATEPHESGRVDRQLLGRAGRQGDPGSGQIFFSMEDEIIQRFLPTIVKSAARKAVAGKLPVWRQTATAACRLAQRKAEQRSRQQRQLVLRSDTWIDESLSFASDNSV